MANTKASIDRAVKNLTPEAIAEANAYTADTVRREEPLKPAPLPAPVAVDPYAGPTFAQTAVAAFNTSNTTVNIIKNLDARHHDIDVNYRKDLDKLRNGIDPQYWGDFDYGRSLGADEDTRERALAKMEDDKVLAASGWTGHGLNALAMFADPFNLTLMGAEVKIASQVVRQGLRLRNAAAAGSVVSASTMAQVALLEGSRGDINGEMVAYTGLFSLAAGAALSGTFVKANTQVGKDLARAARAQQADMDAALVQPVQMTRAMAVEQGGEDGADAILAANAKELQAFQKREAQYAAQNSTALDDTMRPDDSISVNRRNPLFNEAGLFVPAGTDDIMSLTKAGKAKAAGKGAFSDLTDKQAKVEISDDGSWVNYGKIPYGPKQSKLRLGDLLDHAELYGRHPDIADIEVVLNEGKAKSGLGGSYVRGDKSRVYSSEDIPERIVINDVGDHIKYRDIDKVLLHELQHAMQERGSFAKGGWIKDPNYKVLSGEEEARRVEYRRNLSKKERMGDPYGKTDVRDSSRLVTRLSPMGEVSGSLVDEVVPDLGKPFQQRSDEFVAGGGTKGLTESLVHKALLKAGFSDSSWMLSQNANSLKYYTANMLMSGAGLIDNAGNAAVRKYGATKQLLSEFVPEWTSAFKEYAHDNNISVFSKAYYSTGPEDFFKAIRTEKSLIERAFAEGTEHISTASKAVQRAVETSQSMTDKALRFMIDSGVHGFDNIVMAKGYVPLMWQGRAMRNASKEEIDSLIRGYAKSVAEMTEMPLSDAELIGKAVIRRAIHRDLGLDANPHALLSHDSRGFLRESLEALQDAKGNQMMSPEKMDALFARIDARQADSGMSARAKRRTTVDLLTELDNGKSIMDYADNDLLRIYTRYAHEAAGRSALASKGIASEADWTKMVQSIIRDMANTGATDVEIKKAQKMLASHYEGFLGRPRNGGVNKNARRFMDGAMVASLGQTGWAQTAEFAQLVANLGIVNMYETLPALRAYRKAIKNGTVDKTLLGELRPYTGRIGEDHIIFNPTVRLDDALSSDPVWLRTVDNVLGNAKQAVGNLSLMNQVKSIQQQWTVIGQSHKMAKMLHGAEFVTGADGKLLMRGVPDNVQARLKGLGWDTEFLARLKDHSKHFEWQDGVAGGTLDKLNIGNWHNAQDVQKFVDGLHTHSGQLIQEAFIGEDAYWMHSTLGALLTQFRSYPLVAMEKQTARQLKFMDNESFLATGYGLGLSSLVYLAKTNINAASQGGNREKYLKERMTSAAITKGAIAYAGTMSMLQDVINVYDAAGFPGMKSLAGGTAGRTGQTKRAAIEARDIPALGFAQNLFNAGGAGVRLLQGKPLERADINAVQGATMLGNTVPATMLYNSWRDNL